MSVTPHCLIKPGHRQIDKQTIEILFQSQRYCNNGDDGGDNDDVIFSSSVIFCLLLWCGGPFSRKEEEEAVEGLLNVAQG